jgi:prephenate dehydrogenase
METVAIVGVGLIGGSFALGLRQAGFTGRILGVSSPRTLQEALERGVIDEALPLDRAAARADLIYLSLPISRILDTLPEIDSSARPRALVTDVGSTKSRIVERAAQTIHRARFLGGHPMAGKETRGVVSADPELFRNRTYFLTPRDPADLDSEPARTLVGWIRKLGALPVPVSAEEHDRIVAYSSHLPQLASTALAAALAEQPDAERIQQAAGPGLLGSTRLALSSYDIWGDILSTNPVHIDDALVRYIEELNGIRKALSSPDLRRQFQIASDFARKLRQRLD